MKRVIATTVAAIAIVSLIGIGYVYMQNKMSADTQNAESRTRNESEIVLENTKSGPLQEPGVYKAYDKTAVENANGPILLFFHAPWCPQCRAIDEDIVKNGVPDGVTILKVDYDSNYELRKRYEVTLQTTFIRIDSDGNQIAKYVAYNEPTFDSVKTNLLD